MSFKVNLIFFIIFILWNSAFGEVYIVHDHWEAEVQRCSHGEDYRTRTYNIYDQTLNNLGYDFFNENTIVIASGQFLVKASTPKAIETSSLLLNEYQEDTDAKTYMGHLRIDSELTSDNQVAQVIVELRIPRDGLRAIKNYVYAGRWGNLSINIRALSYIYRLRIAS